MDKIFKRRLELHELLCTILKSRNVYFLPPENVKLSYPCIIYNLEVLETRKADNANYGVRPRYTLTYISKTLDTDVLKQLIGLRYCRNDRQFIADGLYHNVFTIYY